MAIRLKSSFIPNYITYLYAILVALFKSLEHPELISLSPINNSSAALPPIATSIYDIKFLFV